MAGTPPNNVNDIVVVVESNDTEKNRQVVERLGARLEAESVAANPTNRFGDVFYKGDLRLMGRKALLFFPETNLVEFSRALGDYRPFMNQFTGATNMASLFRQVNTLIRQSGRERSEKTESFVKALPAMERLLRMAAESAPAARLCVWLDGGRAEEGRRDGLGHEGEKRHHRRRHERVSLRHEDESPRLRIRRRRRSRRRDPGRQDRFVLQNPQAGSRVGPANGDG